MASIYSIRFVKCAAALIATCFSLQARVLAADSTASNPMAEMSVSVVAVQRSCFSDILQVTEVLVEPGDSVTSGQVLARLTAPDGQLGRGLSVPVQSPTAGIVISKNLAIGALASDRVMPLFRIAGAGEMELLAETPAKTLDRILPDQPAKVEFVGVGEFVGKVRLAPTAINPATQLAQLRIFLGSDSRLRVGL